MSQLEPFKPGLWFRFRWWLSTLLMPPLIREVTLNALIAQEQLELQQWKP